MDMIYSIRTFVRVVEVGSFTTVAKENGVTIAQVSRAVSMLENQLQTLLLHRTTRHLSVTGAGATYYERARAILSDLDHANSEARGAATLAQGLIRVHASPGLARGGVTAALIAYQQAHPDVSVELHIEQRVPNLVENGFDLSLIGSAQLPDSAYVSQTLGASHALLVASPAYIAQHGLPASAAELAAHRLLRLSSPVGPADEWHLESAAGSVQVSVEPSAFRSNSPDALLHTARVGAGIAALATYTVFDDLRSGKLVRVLPQYRLSPFNVYALYVSRRYLDAKVRTLIAWLRNHLTPTLQQFEREVEQLAAARPAERAPDAANAGKPENATRDACAPRQAKNASIQTVH